MEWPELWVITFGENKSCGSKDSPLFSNLKNTHLFILVYSFIQFIGHLIPNDSGRLTIRSICVYMYTSQKRIMNSKNNLWSKKTHPAATQTLPWPRAWQNSQVYHSFLSVTDVGALWISFQKVGAITRSISGPLTTCHRINGICWVTKQFSN